MLHCISYPRHFKPCPYYNILRASDEETPIEATNFILAPHCSLTLPSKLNTLVSLEFVIPVSWSVSRMKFIPKRYYFVLSLGHFEYMCREALGGSALNITPNSHIFGLDFYAGVPLIRYCALSTKTTEIIGL